MSSFRQEFLEHARSQPYDPAARRERYLRERRLKGRRVGSKDPPSDRPPKPPSKPSNLSTDPRGPSKTDRPASRQGPTPVTRARIAAMKVRLEQLKVLLAKLVEQAKKEAGVETTTTKETTKKSAETKPEKKTAAEKKEEAKKAKERRDKEPDKPKPDTVASVQAQIDSVRSQIEDARARLAASRKRAPTKTKREPSSDSGFGTKDDKKHPDKKPTAVEGRHH